MHLPDTSPSAMCVGAVVLERGTGQTQRKARWVIWRIIGADRAEAMPLAMSAPPHNAADVVVGLDALSDMGVSASASFESPWIVATGMRRKVRPSIRLGQCPPEVWQAIQRAIRRAGETARIEAAATPRRAR